MNSTISRITSKVDKLGFVKTIYGYIPCPSLMTFLVILICEMNGRKRFDGAEERRRIRRHVYCNSLTTLSRPSVRRRASRSILIAFGEANCLGSKDTGRGTSGVRIVGGRGDELRSVMSGTCRRSAESTNYYIYISNLRRNGKTPLNLRAMFNITCINYDPVLDRPILIHTPKQASHKECFHHKK